MVVEGPGGIVIAEFKTGNPELSPPERTVLQIRRAVEEAKTQYHDQEIVPLLISNDEVDPSIREVLEAWAQKSSNLRRKKPTPRTWFQIWSGKQARRR